MHRRVILVALAGSAAAFMPGAFVGSAPALAKATSGEPPRCRRPPRRSKRREKTSQFFLTICRATRQACALCAAAAPASRWWTGTGTRKRRRTSTTAPARSVARSLRMLLLADVAARPRQSERASYPATACRSTGRMRSVPARSSVSTKPKGQPRRKVCTRTRNSRTRAHTFCATRLRCECLNLSASALACGYKR